MAHVVQCSVHACIYADAASRNVPSFLKKKPPPTPHTQHPTPNTFGVAGVPTPIAGYAVNTGLCVTATHKTDNGKLAEESGTGLGQKYDLGYEGAAEVAAQWVSDMDKYLSVSNL